MILSDIVRVRTFFREGCRPEYCRIILMTNMQSACMDVGIVRLLIKVLNTISKHFSQLIF